MKKKLAALLLTVTALLVALAAGPVFAGNPGDGPTARNRSPKVKITSPSDGATFQPGATILFAGWASDKHEDGQLTADLSWTSNINGRIGTGGSFTTDTLTIGDHTITASVTDSGGATGSASISIYVGTQSSVGTPRSFTLTAALDPPLDPPVYNDGDTVKITAWVTDDEGDPVKGATVYFHFTTANLGLLECTIRTQNSNTQNTRGYATCSYRVDAQRDGVGEYIVVVTASKPGYDPAGPVTVSFLVE